MKRSIIVIIFALFISACKKEIIELPAEKPVRGGNISGALSGSTWLITSSTSTVDYMGTIITTDLYALLPTCYLDNKFTFVPDGTTVNDEGTMKCSANDPQRQVTGIWQLSSDKKTLVLTTIIPNIYGLTKVTSDVLQLDATTLILRYETQIGSAPATITTTQYKRVD